MHKKGSKRCRSVGVCLMIYLVLFIGCLNQKKENINEWKTLYEESGYTKTPNYAQTLTYCQRLAQASSKITFTTFGKSAQLRGIPLLIFDNNKQFKPQPLQKRTKPVVLIQACIHPGESDGKDAGLMLLRDIALFNNYPDMSKHCTILFIPIFNVDGHERFGRYNRINQHGPEEMGWRVTAQNIDLNRDFLKVDSPVMKAWMKLFSEWLPDLLADCHVTNGADYQYVMTYGIETNKNMSEPVQQWTQDTFLPYLKKQMELSGFPMFPYVLPKDWYDLTSGLCTYAWKPRYSTGYGTIQNRVFVLIETHMLKSYKERVTATYELLKNMIAISVRDKNELLARNRKADSITKELTGKKIDLSYRLTNDSTMVSFKGIDFYSKKSSISGDTIISYGKEKKDFTLPFFKTVQVVDSTIMPYAYIIPPQWDEVIDLLKVHGVELSFLKDSVMLSVESYRFSNPSWKDKPYEGRHCVTFDQEKITQTRTYPKGSAVVVCNQRTNQVIAHALEPKGPDSFVFWGYFNAIFERKEYAERYVLEKLAEEMMKKDGQMKKEFENKLTSDSSFANDPRARLYFFYKRSPYWDQWFNVYPVGKIMEEQPLPL